MSDPAPTFAQPRMLEPGRWRIHEHLHGRHVDVVAVTYGRGRVTTTTTTTLCDTGYDRFWCFEDLVAAFLAAAVWDGAPDTEPTGWIKSYDGRRNWQRSEPRGFCPHCGVITVQAKGDPCPDLCLRCAAQGLTSGAGDRR